MKEAVFIQSTLCLQQAKFSNRNGKKRNNTVQDRKELSEFWSGESMGQALSIYIHTFANEGMKRCLD